MAGIRINKIVDASSEYQKWGLHIGKNETRKIVSSQLPYPLRVLRHLPGPARRMVEQIVENAPESSYMVRDSISRKDDPVMPMIRTAVEMLFSEQVPDGSRCYAPSDFDALIVAGSPFSIVDPACKIQIMSDLDSHGVISERLMLGKAPHSKPWQVDVLSESCVSWVKALRHVEDLMDSGKIRSAIVVSFGRPTYYLDPHQIYKLFDHRDDATGSAVGPVTNGQAQIVFGKERMVLKNSNQNQNGDGGEDDQIKAEANGKKVKDKKDTRVVHNLDPEKLSMLQKWSVLPSTCLVGLGDSQNSSDFIASQCAKSLIEMSEKRSIPLDKFDVILLPQVSETFLDKVETELAIAFREKLNVAFHIRDELKQIVRAYCTLFNEYLVSTGKKHDQTCRNFCEVLKQSEKPDSNGELYQLFLSKLTPDETILFNYMKNIRSINFRTYQEAGYTTANSTAGGLAKGIRKGKFNLDSKIAIAFGALGYSFDSLTMNVPVVSTPAVDSCAETKLDIPVSPPVGGWNRIRGALRAVGLGRVFSAL